MYVINTAGGGIYVWIFLSARLELNAPSPYTLLIISILKADNYTSRDIHEFNFFKDGNEQL